MFKKYENIISDFDKFQKYVFSPGPEALRLNGLKIDPPNFLKTMKKCGYRVEQSPYFPDLYFWREKNCPASATVLHWAGYYYIQDPVTLLPVEALGLRPGERVLDLCAAPGGKSFYMAELVGVDGCVVANDPSPPRRQILQSNLQRLGAANLMITSYQGQSVPENEKFAAILVDAPCSGEGSNRWVDGDWPGVKKEQREQLIRTQYMLLKKAARLLAAGGRIVYSTCTYSPLENEAVVNRVLAESELEIAAIERNIPHDSGVCSWQGEDFAPGLKKMWRCYPHHYDGGGMVFALLKKRRQAPPDLEDDCRGDSSDE
ncbi:MAG: RsmB/NOP family class I SAM-dependent RNA methyltransferase [bacterium]